MRRKGSARAQGAPILPRLRVSLARFTGVIRLVSGGAAFMAAIHGASVFPPRDLDFATLDDLRVLDVQIEAAIRKCDADARAWRDERAGWPAPVDFANLPAADLRRYFSEPLESFARKDLRGFERLRALTGLAVETPDPRVREAGLQQIREILVALDNNRRSPAPASVFLFDMPWMALDQAHHPVGRGWSAAANLGDNPDRHTDLSRIDPRASTFWRRPASISTQDLHAGFGRTGIPETGGLMWVYAGPKTSFGGNPGFELRSGRRVIKVKFAETTSEPFTARIFHALGYHVDATDHAPALRIRYDRRLFREFHLRKPVNTEFKLLPSLRVYTLELQKRHDPFAYIRSARLKDGSELDGRALKALILRANGGAHPEDDPRNFLPEAEARIDYLVTVPANVQDKDGPVESIGPWEFEGLGHEHLRELRGAGLLAAWLGWYDSRFENTRLKADRRSGELFHVFTDLGGGLGRGGGFISGRGELPNAFGWEFTLPSDHAPQGVRVTGFKPIRHTAAFELMTLDDARWMARLIARLTERQILEALLGAGFDSARVRLYAEKLLSRRDRMIRDLRLEMEIPLLRPEGVNRGFSYDPAVEGPVRLAGPGGVFREAAGTGDRVVSGRLVAGHTGEALPGRDSARRDLQLLTVQKRHNARTFGNNEKR